MTEEDLRQFIAGGESATVEFKLKAPRPAELAERLCDMANTRTGGVIIFGVEDATREPVGLAEPSETIDIALRAAPYVLHVYSESERFRGGEVVSVFSGTDRAA